MGVWIIRVAFILLCAVVAYQVADSFQGKIAVQPSLMMLGGAAVATGLVAVESLVKKQAVDKLVPPAVGLILGLVTGYFFTNVLVSFWWPSPLGKGEEVQAALRDAISAYLTIALMLVFGYFGLVLGMTRTFTTIDLVERAFMRGRARYQLPKLLDTSVIIDGRIADVCQTGFVEGTLVIPRFVLRELQNIADSGDALRRARGRRGLDILNRIQSQDSKANVEIHEAELEDNEKVDTKLVRLAKQMSAKILTNDFNLNKVAQIEGVSVLNINDLANALKPAVLPDEDMIVKVMKEGKEPGQGIAYLDDGTMIVVDGGKSYMGRDIRVVVTSVLQTAAGKMIFTKVDRAISAR